MERFAEVVELPEFTRDFKALARRYRTLAEDLNVVVNTQLFAFHKLDIDSGGIVQISNLGVVRAPIHKVRKFACKAMKGKGVRTGIRLIYAYFETDDRIELIEIYLHGDKDLEDRHRILMHYAVTPPAS